MLSNRMISGGGAGAFFEEFLSVASDELGADVAGVPIVW